MGLTFDLISHFANLIKKLRKASLSSKGKEEKPDTLSQRKRKTFRNKQSRQEGKTDVPA